VISLKAARDQRGCCLSCNVSRDWQGNTWLSETLNETDLDDIGHMAFHHPRALKHRLGLLATLRQHGLFMVMLGAYALIATWFIFQVPAFAPPNEQLHYEYVALLRRTGQLPDLATSTRMDERHQPPVYYALTAALSLPFPTPRLDTEMDPNPYYLVTHEGNLNRQVGVNPASAPILYVGRLVSLALGLLSLMVLYAAAGAVFSRDTALLIAALMAWQPMFLFLSAELGNDLAVTAACTMVLVWTTFIIVRGWGERAYLIWGVLFATALLTKASAVFLIIVLPFACWTRWRSSGRIWPAVRSGLVAALSCALIYLVWIVFNLNRNVDAAAVSASVPTLDRILGVIPRDLPLIIPYLDRLWRSFVLDWSTAETGFAFDAYYAMAALIVIVTLAGWLRKPYRVRQDGILSLMHAAWILPLWALFLLTKTLMVKEMGVLAPEGRWLLPTLPSLVWLLGSGWLRWWPAELHRSVARGSTLAVTVSTMALALIYVPRFFPAGAQRLASVAELPTDVNSIGLVCDWKLKLLGVRAAPMTTSQRAEVDFYWQALQAIDTNYGISAVLVEPDSAGWKQLDAQRSFPGSGATPTRGWQAGDIYHDRMVFYPRGEMHGPTTALLTVNLLDGKRSLSCAQDDTPLDPAVAQEIIVRPDKVLTPTQRLETPVEFGGYFDLVGVTPVTTAQGLQVTLWWQATAEAPQNYTIFVHLLDQQGQVIAQADSPPVQGLSPTTAWRKGDIVQDTHVVPTNGLLASTLLIGVYDPATGERLSAVQNGQPQTNQAFQYPLPH
jgi:hypothetical protein